MTVCTLPASPPVQQGPANDPRRGGLLAETGEMILRVRGAGDEERLVKIRSPKCSIGSAAGCTLRLRSPEVHAVQCWVLRGIAGTVVRRLHGLATLNGNRFDEAALHPGDCLRVGPVELEVVACNEPAAVTAPLFPPPDGAVSEVVQLKAQLATLEERAARLETESRQGFESSIMAAERADQLRDAMAAAHEQLEEMCRDLTAAQETLNLQTDELAGNQRQLDELHAKERLLGTQLEEARRDVQTAREQCDTLKAERNQARQELEASRQQLESSQTELDQQRQQFDGERTLLERRLAQRDAELEAVRSSTTAQTGAMTVAINELTEGQQSLRDELSAQCAQLEGQLESKQREIDELRRAACEQAATEARLAQLTLEYEQKCNELAGAQAQVACVQAATHSNADLEAREQSLSQLQQEAARQQQETAQMQNELAQRQQELTQGQQELALSRQELAQRRDELATQRASVEAERDELLLQRQELADEQQRVSEQRHQIQQQQEFLAAAQNQQQQPNDREVQLAEQSSELAQQLAAAASRLSDLEHLRDEFLEQRAVLGERTEQLAERERQLANQMESNAVQVESPANCPQLPAQCHQPPSADMSSAPLPGMTVNMTAMWSADNLTALEEQSAQSVEQPAEAPSQSVHDSGEVDAVLSRLVQSGLWRSGELLNADDSAAVSESSADQLSASTAEGAIQPIAQAASSAGLAVADGGVASDGEESIESYMERLMKRVRGEAPLGTIAPLAAQPFDSQPQPSLSSEIATPPPVASEPACEESPEPYSPRRTAPELSTNLSAMRALANSAARSAIDQHVRQHTGKQVFGKLIGACLTLTASLVLGYWAYRGQSLPAGVAASIGGAVGGYWTWAAIRRLASLRRINRVQMEVAKSIAGGVPSNEPANRLG